MHTVCLHTQAPSRAPQLRVEHQERLEAAIRVGCALNGVVYEVHPGVGERGVEGGAPARTHCKCVHRPQTDAPGKGESTNLSWLGSIDAAEGIVCT